MAPSGFAYGDDGPGGASCIRIGETSLPCPGMALRLGATPCEDRVGYPKIRITSPNTGEEYAQTFKSKSQMTEEETKNLLKTAHASKVVNPFTRALTPSFIGRRGDFYIPTIPLNSKNISSVNTYINVFYISYIHKSATSSHAKPGLFETTSLTLLLAGS
jgi:hypothetical protein